jgi:hypothetical protein
MQLVKDDLLMGRHAGVDENRAIRTGKQVTINRRIASRILWEPAYPAVKTDEFSQPIEFPIDNGERFRSQEAALL